MAILLPEHHRVVRLTPVDSEANSASIYPSQRNIGHRDECHKSCWNFVPANGEIYPLFRMALRLGGERSGGKGAAGKDL